MMISSALLCLLAVQEPAVNPRYEQWSGFKPGSWVKMKMVMKMQEMEMETEMVTKLLETTPEKITVEISTRTKVAGRDMAIPPRKEEISSKPDPAKPMKPIGEGEEDVTVAGKTFKCKVYDWEMDIQGQKSKSKAWVTKEIPGGMAKSEFRSDKMPLPMKMEAVEWEKK